MSFSEGIKGADSGFVSTHGQKPAYLPFLRYRRISVTNHKTSTQKLGITGHH
jgi:hypothetical protein